MERGRSPSTIPSCRPGWIGWRSTTSPSPAAAWTSRRCAAALRARSRSCPSRPACASPCSNEVLKERIAAMPSLRQRIVPHLWYATEAEQAARFYASIFPDSRVERVDALPADSPSGPAGSVQMVEFTLLGQPFRAISAGQLDPFNHAISLMVDCQDQAEVDRYWDAL